MEKSQYQKTLEQIQEQAWKNPEVFEIYEQGRPLFREATSKLVADIFNHNISAGSDGKILELGSGVGELGQLVPDNYRSRLVAVEGTESFVKLQRKKDPLAVTAVGKIESLPIKNEAVETVVSFSVFDTLPNPEEAFREVERVLKRGGRFVHLLDLEPNIHVIMSQLPKGFIPFPNFKGAHLSGWQLVREEDYTLIRQELPTSLVKIADIYANDPAFGIQFILEKAQDVGGALSQAVENAHAPKENYPDIAESFADNMNRGIAASGLRLVSVGKQSIEMIVDKNFAHQKFPQCNYFENNIGKLNGKYLPELESELGPNQVKVKVTLHVVVAEK